MAKLTGLADEMVGHGEYEIYQASYEKLAHELKDRDTVLFEYKVGPALPADSRSHSLIATAASKPPPQRWNGYARWLMGSLARSATVG